MPIPTANGILSGIDRVARRNLFRRGISAVRLDQARHGALARRKDRRDRSAVRAALAQQTQAVFVRSAMAA